VDDPIGVPKRLLVVDDEAAIAALLARLLRHAGHDVTVAHDGAQAWDLFQAQGFDLVVTDLKLPHLSGEQLAQRIKALAPHTPIVVLTGHGDQEEEQRLLLIGVARIFAKPLQELRHFVAFVTQLVTKQT
jgi:DNA-binding response OmpR family regulator